MFIISAGGASNQKVHSMNFNMFELMQLKWCYIIGLDLEGFDFVNPFQTIRFIILYYNKLTVSPLNSSLFLILPN